MPKPFERISSLFPPPSRSSALRLSAKMVRGSSVLFKDAGIISKALSDVLVCPLSKQPLRLCQDSQSLVSDAIGVSFPIVDGIPCLVPKDGKFLEDDNASKPDNAAESSIMNK